VKPWDIEELRRALKARWLYRASGAVQFNGRIATDSRTAGAGDLFIAIVGERHDAHTFVADVIDRGVAVVLVHKEQSTEMLLRAQNKDVNLLLVEDTVAALNRLAAAYRGEGGGSGSGMRARVIAVGGSNGKTTTKFIIHTLLSEKFNGHASPKSFNNNIGMPLTLLEVDAAHEYVVLEIGTNKPGEIAALGEVCRPDIAVITSIGLEHLEFFGDLDGVAREEASIAAYVAAGGTLVLPAAASELFAYLKNAGIQKILVGRKPAPAAPHAPLAFVPDLMLTDVKEAVGGTTFSINGRGAFSVPLLGEHNAMNAIMAIAVARRLGLSDEQIRSGLAKVKAAEGRLQPMAAAESGAFSIINDAYNANPSSMEASLNTFARLAHSGSRKVVILADMLELGPTAPALHRSIGGLVSARNFDLFIAIGPLMGLAADVAAESNIAVRRCASAAAAKEHLQEMLRPGDQILLKGSHSMELESLIPAMQPLSSPLAART